MDVRSSSEEDDITSSAYRRKKRVKHLPQRTQNDTDSEDEKILESSVKSRVRNRKCVCKESDNSESDNQSEHAEKVSTEDVKGSLISQARTTKSPTTVSEGNQFEAPTPEHTESKRKTRNLIKQEKIKNLQENNDENGFKMDSLLSKHSDLFDCESDNDDLTPTLTEEWRGKIKPAKQKKEPKIARLNKKEQFKLHSEAQRVVRESNISLPKYQPKVKTLDDFLKKLKSRNTDSIKPTVSIKRMKEPAQPEESLTLKPVSNGSNSESTISPVVVCQEESSSILSASLQGKTAAVTNSANDGEASQDVLPDANPSMSQKDALLLNQDSVMMELDNSQCSNTVGATKLMHAQVMKAVKDVPVPKLCSHTEWEETQVVSPVEELQKRLVKHASIVTPDVVEDSGLTRDEWKSILYKQVSERRASERKAIDEMTKLDNEEFSPAESEAELTDEESIASGHEKEETDKVMNKEGDEVSKEGNEEKNGEEEHQMGWQSDFNGSFSDEDNVNDDDDDDDDGVEGDDSEDEENSDDELIVKTKKLTKQLESDSEPEAPSQTTSKPPTPVIRNFPFDKEMSFDLNQTSDFINDTVSTKEESLPRKDGDKKEFDSGLGISLLAGVSSEIDNPIADDNLSKPDNIAVVKDAIPKRPSEDDTIMTIESNSLLSNATELDRSSRSASNSICHYDEETQFLDSNGFLNVKQKIKQPPALELDDSAISSQLIQLCSGQFSPKNVDNNKSLSAKPVDLDQSFLLQRKDSKDLPTTQGVRELLGSREPTSDKPLSKSISSMLLESSRYDNDNSQVLALCSGNFSSQFTPFSNTKHHQQTSDGMTDDSSSDDGDELMMLTNSRCLSKNPNHTPLMNTNIDGSDDEMPRLSKRRSRKYLKNKEKNIKRRRLEEFVESEAELSGSDYGMASDEERAYLDNEEDEILEKLSGDSDINNMSEDELKKQVNRVHMKYTLADDSANIKDIKERFLPGGDLYEDGIMLKDGYFRKRKFAHVGSETSLDLFADDRVLDSGDEQFNDENSQAEAMRRKQRLEKEEFLSQMRQHDSLLDDENSQQLLRLVKPTSVKITGTVPLNKQRPATVQLYSSKTLKNSCGSFLKQNKDKLTKLSLSVTSTTIVNLSSSKNFVFQTAATPTAGQSERTAPQLKKSNSVKSKTGKSPRKAAYKRSRSLPQDEDSIFNILNNL